MYNKINAPDRYAPGDFFVVKKHRDAVNFLTL
jgi:hypothetical protein